MSNYLFGYAEQSKGFKFYDLTLKNIFEVRIATFFEDVEFRSRNKLMDIDFEEESISIPTTITFDNVRIFIPVIDHEVTPKPQHDIVELPLIDHVGQHDHIDILPIQD